MSETKRKANFLNDTASALAILLPRVPHSSQLGLEARSMKSEKPAERKKKLQPRIVPLNTGVNGSVAEGRRNSTRHKRGNDNNRFVFLQFYRDFLDSATDSGSDVSDSSAALIGSPSSDNGGSHLTGCEL